MAISVERQLAWRAKQAEAKLRKYTVVYYVLVRRNAYVEVATVRKYTADFGAP